MALTLTSPAFELNEKIPAKYTCDGDRELSPPLAWSGAPEGTKSFALIMDDPDIPQFAKEKHGIEVFDHWVLYNIPAGAAGIPEGGTAGMPGVTSRGDARYTGPCPPPEHEPSEHHYVFMLYALREPLSFNAPPPAAEVRTALAPVTLAEAKLIGRYSRR